MEASERRQKTLFIGNRDWKRRAVAFLSTSRNLRKITEDP
jgi:hypothetical protein